MTLHIGLLLYPNVTQLDATGPAQVLARVPDAKIHMVWKQLEPVATDAGFTINPTTRMDQCPALDVICIPGGYGQMALMRDEETLDFVRRQGARARYVTSVCTGALVLGAAGLLKGYRAATHWAFMDVLTAYGAVPVNQRVVIDRNRITGGGVTAGIDFGLTLAARLAGDHVAKVIQLALEYNPQPPFACGHPDTAEPAVLEEVRTLYAQAARERLEAAR